MWFLLSLVLQLNKSHFKETIFNNMEFMPMWRYFVNFISNILIKRQIIDVQIRKLDRRRKKGTLVASKGHF